VRSKEEVVVVVVVMFVFVSRAQPERAREGGIEIRKTRSVVGLA
jgi:hypothetical protein